LIIAAILTTGILLWAGELAGKRREENLPYQEKFLQEAQKNQVLYFMEREGEGGA
jgi:hypothetical protein